jgi:hypothetical protein
VCEGQNVWKGCVYTSVVESLSLAFVSDCGFVEECVGKCVEMHSYGRKSHHSENTNIHRKIMLK